MDQNLAGIKQLKDNICWNKTIGTNVIKIQIVVGQNLTEIK